MTGIGVGEAGTVAVEGRVGSGVRDAVWQAEVRSRSPIRRIFFIILNHNLGYRENREVDPG